MFCLMPEQQCSDANRLIYNTVSVDNRTRKHSNVDVILLFNLKRCKTGSIEKWMMALQPFVSLLAESQ